MIRSPFLLFCRASEMPVVCALSHPSNLPPLVLPVTLSHIEPRASCSEHPYVQYVRSSTYMPSPVVVPSKYYMYVLYTSFLSNKKICMKKLSLTLFYLVLSHRLDLHRSTPTTPPPHASITVYVFIIYYLLLIFLILTDTDHNPGGGSGFEHEQTS